MVQETTKLEKDHDSESRKVYELNFFPVAFTYNDAFAVFFFFFDKLHLNMYVIPAYIGSFFLAVPVKMSW